MLGEFFGRDVISTPRVLELLRREVEKGGDTAEIELWSDGDMKGDYTPSELGTGA